MMRRVWNLPVVLGTITIALGGMLYEGSTSPAAAEGLFDDVNIGLFSIGGRATYVDPKDGDANWFGGGQLRIHPFHFMAIEGSVDYRKTDLNSTNVRTFPVQGSVLLYPFGTKRLSPFILGGAAGTLPMSKAPATSTRRNIGLARMSGRPAALSHGISLARQYLSSYLAREC